MNAMHKHKAILKDRHTVGWTQCVQPHQCAADPRLQAAHGGVVHRDTCQCGASRYTEVNGNSRNRGPWVEER